MGREILCTIRWQGVATEGKVVLESTELILRGEIRARIGRDRITGWSYAEGTLTLRTANSPLELDMPGGEAAAWMRALAKSQPGLAEKLGINPSARAFLIGPADDADLARALVGTVTGQAGEATVLIAVLTNTTAIDPAAALATATGRPVWCLYPKGKGADPSDAQVRAAMRAQGFVDVKSCMVSDRLTATKYLRRT